MLARISSLLCTYTRIHIALTYLSGVVVIDRLGFGDVCRNMGQIPQKFKFKLQEVLNQIKQLTGEDCENMCLLCFAHICILFWEKISVSKK